jgi:hypothetical protein
MPATLPASVDPLLVSGDSVYVAPGLAGRGLFAARPFTRGELVLQFEGRYHTGEELDRLGFTQGYPLQIGASHFVLLDEPYVYCNHSCDPNTGLTPELALRAVRDIAIGEEISFDYSTTMLEDNSWTLECGCNSALCRGRIEDFDRLHPHTQQRLIDSVGVLPFILDLLSRRGG